MTEFLQAAWLLHKCVKLNVFYNPNTSIYSHLCFTQSKQKCIKKNKKKDCIDKKNVGQSETEPFSTLYTQFVKNWE